MCGLHGVYINRCGHNMCLTDSPEHIYIISFAHMAGCLLSQTLYSGLHGVIIMQLCNFLGCTPDG